MKKTLLFFSVLFTLSAKGQTSVYHPFPDSNAVWNIHLVCFMGAAQADYSIIISDDTLINSQKYHKLTTPFVQSASTTSLTCGVATGYKGAIRQDIPNKKVYFVPPAGNSEQLLYDFTMQVGDTVKGYIETSTNPKDTVQSIDSVLVGNTYRKRWKINSCYNIYFIEGIGSTYGLINPSPGCVTDQKSYVITCFRQNNQTLYPSTTTNCELITSINFIGENSNQTKIFPNPSNGKFTLSSELGKGEVSVYTISGKKIYTSSINTGKLFTIDLRNEQAGIYLLQIKAEQGSDIKKIVIQK